MNKKCLYLIVSVFLVVYFNFNQQDIDQKDTISEVKIRMIDSQKSKTVTKYGGKAESFENHIDYSVYKSHHPEPEIAPENVTNEEPAFESVSVYFDNMEEFEDETGQKYVYIPGHEENGARIQIKIKSSDWAKLVGHESVEY